MQIGCWLFHLVLGDSCCRWYFCWFACDHTITNASNHQYSTLLSESCHKLMGDHLGILISWVCLLAPRLRTSCDEIGNYLRTPSNTALKNAVSEKENPFWWCLCIEWNGFNNSTWAMHSNQEGIFYYYSNSWFHIVFNT